MRVLLPVETGQHECHHQEDVGEHHAGHQGPQVGRAQQEDQGGSEVKGWFPSLGLAVGCPAAAEEDSSVDQSSTQTLQLLLLLSAPGVGREDLGGHDRSEVVQESEEEPNQGEESQAGQVGAVDHQVEAGQTAGSHCGVPVLGYITLVRDHTLSDHTPHTTHHTPHIPAPR